MKNINWSKWIAVALSIFIVTQFIEVSFLAVRHYGGSNASADATEADGVAGLYEGLLSAVGEDGGLIMNAKADEDPDPDEPDDETTNGIDNEEQDGENSNAAGDASLAASSTEPEITNPNPPSGGDEGDPEGDEETGASGDPANPGTPSGGSSGENNAASGNTSGTTGETLGNANGTTGDTSGNTNGITDETLGNTNGTTGDTSGNTNGTTGETLGNANGTTGDTSGATEGASANTNGTDNNAAANAGAGTSNAATEGSSATSAATGASSEATSQASSEASLSSSAGSSAVDAATASSAALAASTAATGASAASSSTAAATGSTATRTAAPVDPSTLPITATITIKVQDATETALESAEFSLQWRASEDDEWVDYDTIAVTSTAGASESLVDGFYRLTQTSVAEGYTAYAGFITFSVSEGVVTATSGDGWSFANDAFTVTNAFVVRRAALRSTAKSTEKATTAITITDVKDVTKGAISVLNRKGTGTNVEDVISGVAQNDELSFDFTVVLSDYNTGTALSENQVYTITLPTGWTYSGDTNLTDTLKDDLGTTLITYGINKNSNVINVTRNKLAAGKEINIPDSLSFTIPKIKIGAAVSGDEEILWKDDVSGNNDKKIKVEATPVETAVLQIKRNIAVPYDGGVVETPITGTESNKTQVTFKIYEKTADGKYNAKGTCQTDLSTGIAIFSGLVIDGTSKKAVYYIEETTKLPYQDKRYDGVADYTYKEGEPDKPIDKLDENDYWPVEVGPGTTTVVMDDNPCYSVMLVDAASKPISGKSMKLTVNKGKFYHFYQIEGTEEIAMNNAKTSASWTSGTAGAFFDGTLEYGKTYTLTVPSATDTTKTEDFTLAVGDTAGSEITCTSSNKTDFKYEDGVVIIKRAINTGSMEYQLVDATSKEDIKDSTAAFKLYTDDACTKDSGIKVTNTKGLITATIPAGTYYLMQVAKKAPVGYVENTGKHKIIVSAAGALTYPTTSEWTVATTTSEKTKFSYERIKPTLTLKKSDSTGTITYGVYTTEDATDGGWSLTADAGYKQWGSSKVESITLTNGIGSTEKSDKLAWNTPYYLKETTSTATDKAIHGPYVFSATMTGGVADTTTYTANPETMTIVVDLKPESVDDPVFVLNRINNSATEPASGAEFTVKGEFADLNGTVTKSFTTDAYGKPSIAPTGFKDGKEYTVTETKVSKDGYSTVAFKFTHGASGETIGDITGGKVTANGRTITMTEVPVTTVKITMLVCTYERGDKFEDHVDRDAETSTVAGFAFKLYTDDECKTEYKGADGKTLGTLATNDEGTIEIKGIPDGTYYLRYVGTVSDSDAKKATYVESDTKSIFKFTVANGELTSDKLTKSNDSGTWKASDGNIRAYLKEGKIKLTAPTDKKYYIYRLYSGSDGETNDKRGKAKMTGETKNFKDNKNIKVAGLDELFFDALAYIDSFFTLKVRAADTKTIEYADATWELIGSVQPGKGNSSTLDGLVAGQVYLVREGDSESTSDSDRYFLVATNTSEKSLSPAAASTSNTATTANTANTGRTNTGTTSGSGTGTGSNSGSKAGGARGTATGDASDLWLHLIIMLIAFDALAADLLYISRKKQAVRRR